MEKKIGTTIETTRSSCWKYSAWTSSLDDDSDEEVDDSNVDDVVDVDIIEKDVNVEFMSDIWVRKSAAVESAVDIFTKSDLNVDPEIL